MRPLTKSQAVCLTVMTGALLMDPKDFREAIGKRLGREVNAAEFANDSFILELQQLFADDYKQLLTIVEDSGIILYK